MPKIEKLRGFRDFLPEDMEIRNFVKEKIEKIFKIYGFREILTPTLEYVELYTLKSGDEIKESMFEFKDKGNRNVCLKPEETASVCRFYLENFINSSLPLKFYYFCPVFRYDEPQKGRYREFWHLGVELFGSNDFIADVEIINLAVDGLKELNLNFTLKISDIRIIKGILENLKIDNNEIKKILHYIDKNQKDKLEKFMSDLSLNDAYKNLEKILSEKENYEILKELEELKKNYDNREIFEGIENLKKISYFLDLLNIKHKIDLNIVRGLEYYTSTVFEIFSSGMQICGGGRYDNLISLLSENRFYVPAVGFAYGFDRVIEAMKDQNLISIDKKIKKILIIPLDEKFKEYSIKVLEKLRKESKFIVEIELMNRNIGKAMSYA
ncbi:MAG: histidine--tRNA ligase, partial [Candidatus Altarchaeaceae archaeon]